jgi:arylsulfate sulfotransferase
MPRKTVCSRQRYPGRFAMLISRVGAIIVTGILLGCSQSPPASQPTGMGIASQTPVAPTSEQGHSVEAEASSQADDSFWIGVPEVRPNPITRAPLVGIVDFETRAPTTAAIEISDGGRTWTYVVDKPNTKHSVTLLGLYPNRTHKITVTARTVADGQEQVRQIDRFNTPPLPNNFPPISTTVAVEEKMEPGIRMFAVNNWTDSVSLLDYGFLIAMDNTGQVVWYCQTGDRTADCRVLQNGNILYQHGSYRYLYEIDILGRDLRSWYASRSVEAPNEQSIAVDVDTIHHEIIELPNGNFLTLATELRFFEEYPSDEFNPQAPLEPAWVVCDEIVEFRPDTGDIVKRLPLTEKLDTRRFGYLCLNRFWKDKYDDFIDSPCRDWSHANALQYLPQDNAVLVSLRHMNCLIKLDWHTDEVLWMFGDPTGWAERFQPYFLKPEQNLLWPYHQHSPHFTESGLLLMFDNGNYRAVPYQPPTMAPDNSSRIVAFQIDQEHKTVKQVYSYGAAQGDQFYSPFYGEAEVLPKTRNLLITDGGHIETAQGVPNDVVPCERQWARIFEITSKAQPEKVYEMFCASTLGSNLGWSIYRCNHYPSLYEPLVVKTPESDERPMIRPRESIKKLNPLDSYTPVEVSSKVSQ